jgi:hypothetical protein
LGEQQVSKFPPISTTFGIVTHLVSPISSRDREYFRVVEAKHMEEEPVQLID